jgi:uncharacterized protein YndB with AHSA1/START domain
VRVEADIEIARSPAEVWDVVADRANDPRWCRKVKAVERVGDGQWNVWHKPVPLQPSALLRVRHIRAEAPKCLVMREEDAASTFTVEYRLEPTRTGTTFTQISEFTWKKLPRALQAIFAYGVRRDIQAQLRGLKRLLETA